VNVDGAAGSIIAFRESVHPGNVPSPDHKTKDDHAYHQAREQVERRAAQEAASVQSRRIHQELAEAHSKLAHDGWPRGH
jgi:hypothetical protein